MFFLIEMPVETTGSSVSSKTKAEGTNWTDGKWFHMVGVTIKKSCWCMTTNWATEDSGTVGRSKGQADSIDIINASIPSSLGLARGIPKRVHKCKWHPAVSPQGHQGPLSPV